MSSTITELREAVGAALEGLDGGPQVFTHAAGSIDPPCVVIANGTPWIARADEDDGGYSIRVIRHQLLLALPNSLDAETLERFETWVDELPSILRSSDVSAMRMHPPRIVTVQPPQLIEYGKATLAGVLVDIESHQQTC